MWLDFRVHAHADADSPALRWFASSLCNTSSACMCTLRLLTTAARQRLPGDGCCRGAPLQMRCPCAAGRGCSVCQEYEHMIRRVMLYVARCSRVFVLQMFSGNLTMCREPGAQATRYTHSLTRCPQRAGFGRAAQRSAEEAATLAAVGCSTQPWHWSGAAGPLGPWRIAACPHEARTMGLRRARGAARRCLAAAHGQRRCGSRPRRTHSACCRSHRR